MKQIKIHQGTKLSPAPIYITLHCLRYRYTTETILTKIIFVVEGTLSECAQNLHKLTFQILSMC